MRFEDTRPNREFVDTSKGIIGVIHDKYCQEEAPVSGKLPHELKLDF
jgi:hypothetical protein